MRKNPLFLQWLLVLSILFALTLIGTLSGAVQWIQRNDPTGISFSICIIGYLVTMRFGGMFYHLGSSRQDRIRSFLPTAAYASGVCRDLGFFGTIVGFVKLLPVFLHLNQATPDAIIAIIQSMGINLGTAFVTTMVGLAASMVIDFQGRRLAHALEKQVSHD